MNATYIDELNNRASKKQTFSYRSRIWNNSSTTPSSRYTTPLMQDELNSARKAAVPKKTAGHWWKAINGA